MFPRAMFSLKVIYDVSHITCDGQINRKGPPGVVGIDVEDDGIDARAAVS